MRVKSSFAIDENPWFLAEARVFRRILFAAATGSGGGGRKLV